MEYPSILRRKKDGDWYIYPQFLAHENFNNVHKKVQKSYKIFRPTIHNVLSTEEYRDKYCKNLAFVRFARYCGKMYSRHLFSYGGLLLLLFCSWRGKSGESVCPLGMGLLYSSQVFVRTPRRRSSSSSIRPKNMGL